MSVSSVSIFVTLELIAIATIVNISFYNGSSSMGCIEGERQALLGFKQHLIDPSNRLASWINTDGDCCAWIGVVCSNLTSHVLELHLENPVNAHHDYDFYEAYKRSMLTGMVPHQLGNLSNLQYLDLSYNNFSGMVSHQLGNLSNLQYLNLSGNEFMGIVPHQLGNLSNLQYIDLSGNYNLYVENFQWFSTLSMLQHLDLTSVNLSKASDWVSVTNTLPALVVLQLSSCELPHVPSLSSVNFSSLAKLDLSSNHFDSSSIPSWVFSLTHLDYLDFSYNSFQGPIPNLLQNLTSLSYLDLSSNDFNSSIPDFLYQLSHLRYLSLSSNSLKGTIPDLLYQLSRLRYLSLSSNSLKGTISDKFENLTSIESLDLSYNKIQGKIPRSFGKLCHLRSIFVSGVNLSQDISEILDIFSGCVSNRLERIHLIGSDLYGRLTNQIGQFKSLRALGVGANSISGLIPSSLGGLSSLEYLFLWSNNFSGIIPSSLGGLSSLRYLYLKSNNFSGIIPSSLGGLSSLRYLDLRSNNFSGTLSQVHFANLTQLRDLILSENPLLRMKVSSTWVPPFQLQILAFSSCYLGPRFPAWLRSQKQLLYLDASNSNISDTIPSWFWQSLPNIYWLNLSRNHIYGKIPDLTESSQLAKLDLGSNNFSDSLPLITSSRLEHLDLSNNAFSGSIDRVLCNLMEESELQVLNLRGNRLSGEIPDCWTLWQQLIVMDLGNNNFIGELPKSIGTLSLLRSMHIQKNYLSGVVPVSLVNCTELVTLDLSENEFVGTIPTWIGEKLSKIKVLNLRSNKFQGPLPMELCRLASLQVLDLACNNLSGRIPRCIMNFNAMVAVNYTDGNKISFLYYVKDSIGSIFEDFDDQSLVMKGEMNEYGSILNLVRKLDLSKNNFSGEIPEEVTHLAGLGSLNLSYNSLTRKIPENIGAMSLMEEIDFSCNQLFGQIPQSISSLTYLRYLNVSKNNLTGKIPIGPQLQTFDASWFAGNELCGAPLPRNCTASSSTPENENKEGKDEPEKKDEMLWIYVSMVFGFIVGFWGFVGPLFVNRRWRYTYYNFLDYLGYKVRDVVRNYF
nr:receptor-like protein EIX2 [Nitraria sibirica]